LPKGSSALNHDDERFSFNEVLAKELKMEEEFQH
jgi:hypothetical protein